MLSLLLSRREHLESALRRSKSSRIVFVVHHFQRAAAVVAAAAATATAVAAAATTSPQSQVSHPVRPTGPQYNVMRRGRGLAGDGGSDRGQTGAGVPSSF